MALGMDIKIPRGLYVIAVSGGVDSMVLLDLAVKKPGVNLIVGHFNHGIRADGNKDEALVRKAVRRYGLSLEVGHGGLGSEASEAQARQARYAYLRSVKQHYKARAILMAHHQDDLIETAIINIIRGTGYRGLVSISKNPEVVRPLLKFSKSRILSYARQNSIIWREDASNLEIDYLRNWVRHKLVPKLDQEARAYLLTNIDKVAKTSGEIESLIATISQKIVKGNQISRYDFVMLPPEVGQQLIMRWLKMNGITLIDRKMVDRLAGAIKTAKPGTSFNISENYILKIEKQSAYILQTSSG